MMDKETQKVMSQAGWKNWDHSCPRFPHWEGAFYCGCSWHPRKRPTLTSVHFLLLERLEEINQSHKSSTLPDLEEENPFCPNFVTQSTWVRPSHWGSGDFSTPLSTESNFLFPVVNSIQRRFQKVKSKQKNIFQKPDYTLGRVWCCGTSGHVSKVLKVPEGIRGIWHKYCVIIWIQKLCLTSLCHRVPDTFFINIFLKYFEFIICVGLLGG